MKGPLIIYGGTFDPVHFGHLRTAVELSDLCGPDAEVRMMPCGDPRHRHIPRAQSGDRFKMLCLAINSSVTCQAIQHNIKADDYEIKRVGATYTIDTLTELRQQVGLRPVILVMGGDAFLQFNKWHRWLEIIGLAHIMVIRRPNCSVNGQHALTDFYQKYLARDLTDLFRTAAGSLFECQLTQLDISATSIREILAQGRSARFLLPDRVLDYIYQHQLYGIASTSPEKIFSTPDNCFTESDN